MLYNNNNRCNLFCAFHYTDNLKDTKKQYKSTCSSWAGQWSSTEAKYEYGP
jgi:hypothetical protein